MIISEQNIVQSIYSIRGKKAMLDRDLALMYGVETRVLNQAVKRNLRRFPDDFMFQLSKKEWTDLKSQIVISNSREEPTMGGIRKLPYAFTEQGVAMLSSVLNSETAIEVNIQIIRIFLKIREMLFTQKDFLLKLETLEQKILKQDKRHKKNEEEIQLIFKALKQLLQAESPPRKRIGFKP